VAQGQAAPSAQLRLRRRLGLLLLQALPLLGLGGCSAIWTVVPVNSFLSQAQPPAFWSFALVTLLCGLLTLCWGFGYLYLGRRERFGCLTACVGPVVVLIGYGYLFEGFRLASNAAGELARRQAMLATLGLIGGPLLLLLIDLWRLSGQPVEEK
jgi:hypothetical protein